MKKRLSLISTLFISLMTAGLALSGAASAQTPTVVHGVRDHSHLRNGTSTNWSGYAVETNLKTPTSGAVSDVSGSWVVPTVTCPAHGSYYSSAWVGIDGYGDSTVEQTGTEQDCSRGRAHYYAWYEFYPQSELLISGLAVHPGDTMHGDVNYVGSNTFAVTITDQTTGASYTTTRLMSTAQRQSAEWIAEAPSSWSGVLPLANFGTMGFTNASATLNGVTGTITNAAWQNDPLTMVTNSGQPKATLSNLSADGSSFNVTWQHS